MRVYRPIRKGKKADSTTTISSSMVTVTKPAPSSPTAAKPSATPRIYSGRSGAARWMKRAGQFRKLEVPTLRDFASQFREYIEVRLAQHPKTISFYFEKLQRLLEYELLADACLSEIDEALVEHYIQWRRKAVAPGTVNRQLATLRRLLGLARTWKIITQLPQIKRLPGERGREFVLSHGAEIEYLRAAPQPLRDLALMDVDTGLRISELLTLEWANVHLEAVGNAKFGYVRASGKTGQRNVPITERVRSMLKLRKERAFRPTSSRMPLVILTWSRPWTTCRRKSECPWGCPMSS
jgi:integrase